MNVAQPPTYDPVHLPKHYNVHPSGIQCIEITQHMSFNLGNAFKYLFRCDDKEKLFQDLDKSLWYVRREFEHRNIIGTHLWNIGAYLKNTVRGFLPRLFNYPVRDMCKIALVTSKEPDGFKAMLLDRLWQSEVNHAIDLRVTAELLEKYIQRRKNEENPTKETPG